MPPPAGRGRPDEPRFETGYRPGSPGSYEYTRPELYPNVSPETRRQRSHIMSPSLSFRTDAPLVSSFIRMLRALDEADFHWVLGYSGPRLGLRARRREPVGVGTLVEALEGDWDAPIPMGGLKAKLLYEHGRGVVAKLRVGGLGSTKVGVKVKGTMRLSHWTAFHRRVARKFKVTM